MNRPSGDMFDKMNQEELLALLSGHEFGGTDMALDTPLSHHYPKTDDQDDLGLFSDASLANNPAIFGSSYPGDGSSTRHW